MLNAACSNIKRKRNYYKNSILLIAINAGALWLKAAEYTLRY